MVLTRLGKKKKKTFTYNSKTTLHHTSSICLLPAPPPHHPLGWLWEQAHHTGHVWVYELYTSPIALTRGVYLSLRGGTTLQTRGKTSRCIQGICWTRHSHLVDVWNEINKEAVCLCRRRTHAEMSHRSVKLAGRNREIWYSKSRLGSRYQQVTLLGITSYPFIHKYPGLPAWALAKKFLDRRQVVSQSQVTGVCFVSQCLSGAACARPFCVVVTLY